jgi:hypothetical protein
MIRLMRRFGIRQGWALWHLQRAWRTERRLSEWQHRNAHPLRTHHEPPRMAGYRRKR